MTKTKKTLLITGYLIAAALFFLYYLFPSEAIVRQIVARVKGANPAYSLSIAQARPAFPPGLRLETTELNFKDLPLFKADTVKISPSLRSLFSKDTEFSFKGWAYQGTLTGKLKIAAKAGKPQLSGEVQIFELRIADLPALQNLVKHRISGILKGKIDFSKNGPRQNGTGNLLLTDCRIELEQPLYNLKSIDFKSINADFKLENQLLRINECILSGSQVNGRISGNIRLADAPEKSALDLTGTVQPHPQFLAELRKSVPIDLILNQKSGTGGLGFRINGTLDQPGVALK